MKMKLFFFALLIISSLKAQDKVNDKYLSKLDRIFKLHELVKDIHPTLKNVYPVAIVENGQFYVYEPQFNNQYKFIKQSKVVSFVPPGIKAAYPLAENDNKMTCVVTDEVFESMDGYAIIFHEFVHCAQFSSVEMKLKNDLEIYQLAMKRKDWMWELNYPFPYSKKEFVDIYSELYSVMDKNNLADAEKIREKIKMNLSKDEYSYMTWVEWKEGFARWVENKVRNKFRIGENHGGRTAPFNRTAFYESGEQFIDLIFKSNPDAVNDLGKLYEILKN